VIAEQKHMVERGAELVELRLDYIKGDVSLRRLLQDRPCPVIISCRRTKDGGKYTGTEEARLMLLRSAVAAGVDYVDLEEDVAASIPRFGATRRIISHHDFRKTPDDLAGLHAQLDAFDADIVKIATMANHPHDNLRVLELIKKSKTPTVALCMGDMGTPSRILGGHFGAPFTFATFHHERTLAPGQLSFDQMREIYHYDEIDEQTALYGVVADPIGHSLSPQIHNAAFRHLGLNAVYIPFRAPREDLGMFIEDAKKLNLRGLSVTIPHKEAIARYLTKIDAAAKGIEAVNTVVFEGQDLVGYNTDCKAAMDSLTRALASESRPDHDPLPGKSALVLGAGGAARAIVYGLTKHKVKTTISSRTAGRAVALAKKYGAAVVDWSARHKVGPEILINCTPVGMHPDVDATPFEKSHLRPSMVVFDTVYNPESTLLVKSAQRHGCRVVTGVEMFVRQASLQFRLFTGQKPPGELMREVLKRTIGPVKY
jgi:3-dehydroquinate dehydratase/shikimate dehydrogenase